MQIGLDSSERHRSLNFVTPLPPLPTEIANHSALVLTTVARRTGVVAWTDQAHWTPAPDYEIRRFAIHNVPVASLSNPRPSFYNIGNNISFHAAIWTASRRAPGVVILHDTALQHFFQAFANTPDGAADYIAMMGRCHGPDGIAAAMARLHRGEGDMVEMMRRFPMTQAAFEGSRGVIVHNEHEARRLRRLTTAPVWHLPLAGGSYTAIAAAKGRRSKPLRLIMFGHMGDNRRLVEMVRALGLSTVRDRYRLDVYGLIDDAAPLMAEIHAHHLVGAVSVHGFVPEAVLDKALSQADLALNLRHPTAGEASSGQLRVWAHALPSLVTQAGWYATLPPGTVDFVRLEHEAEDIERHLVAFAADPAPYRRSGRAGRDHRASVHGADDYADALLDIADELSRPRAVIMSAVQDAPASCAPGVVGHIDSFAGATVTGWARCLDGSGVRPLVRAFIDGRLAAETPADLYREDVRRAGQGDGFCGFKVDLSSSHHVARDAVLTVVALSGDMDTVLLDTPLATGASADQPDAADEAALAGRLHLTIAGHVNGSYSLAAVNRTVAAAFEGRRPGRARLIAVEGGPTDFLGEVPPGWAEFVTRLIARAPATAGADVVISQHYPVHVPHYRGDLTLAMVFWEESLFPAATVRVLNEGFSAVLAPSSFVARLLVESGVAIPVINIGQTAPLGAFAALPPRPARAVFTFLHVSSAFPRKGLDTLLTAWRRAFRARDAVRLVIKSIPNPHNDAAAQIDRLRAIDPDAAAIQLVDQDLDEATLLALYAGADAMVLPTRGEGYNLPAAEAMAAGLKLIVTDTGGHRDFAGPGTARLVRSRPAPARTHLASAHSLWREPDVDDLTAALQEVVRGVPPGQVAAARAAALAAADGEGFVGRLTALAARLLLAGPPPPVRLVWITTWGVRCGVAAYARALVDAMPRDGVARLAILCDDRTPGDGDTVRPCWHLGAATGTDALVAAVQDEDADVVMVQHQPGLLGWGALAALLTALAADGRAAVVTLHNTAHLLDVGAAERDGAVAALRGVARVLVHTIADLDRLEALGLRPVLLPHGAPAPHGPTSRRPARALPPDSAPVIGCYGFFLPGKGIDTLIEAVATLRGRWPRIDLRLVNADYGGAGSAEAIAACRAIAAACGLAVAWHLDFLPEGESAALLAGCDLIALPYAPSQEASSAAARSALASGVPVAVTPIALFDDLGDAVARLPGGDAAAVAAGIAALLDDPERRDAVAAAARRWLADRAVPDIAGRLAGLQRGLAAQRWLGVKLDGGLADRLPDARTTTRPVLAQRPPATLHIDVTDLLHFFVDSATPTGIQRVQLGLITQWLAQPERRRRVRFALYADDHQSFHPVAAADIEWLIDSLACDADATARPERLSAIIRFAIQANILRPARGDTLLVMGVFWSNSSFHRAIRALQGEAGIHYVQFFHDAVPVMIPETIPFDTMAAYCRGLALILSQADAVCAVSHHAAGDLRMLAARLGLPCPPIEVVYSGTPAPAPDGDPLPPGLDDFVLCVGTIEPRKNHLYLFHLWRRLLSRGGRPTPKLVCVGHYGWLNEGFQRHLRATDNLGGHIVILTGVGDAQLRTLYRHCRFTIYPSLYEGWGLPVTESLAAGRLCVTSNVSAMPESGGPWAAYLDPFDLESGFDVVAGLIENPEQVRARNAAIAETCWLPGWADAADAFWGAIERLANSAAIAQRDMQTPPLIRIGEQHELRPAIPSSGPLALTRTTLAAVDFAQILFGREWNVIEIWGVWAMGRVARLVFQTETLDDDDLTAYLRVGLPEVSGPNAFSVTVNGAAVVTTTLRPGPQPIRVPIARGGQIRLDITLAHEITVPGDLRRLGIGLRSLFVCRSSDVAARLAFLEGQT